MYKHIVLALSLLLILPACNLMEVLEENGCPEGELPLCPDHDGDEWGYCGSLDDLRIETDIYYVSYDKDKGLVCLQEDLPEGYVPAIWGQDCDDADRTVGPEQNCFWPEEVCEVIESDYEAVYPYDLLCEEGIIDYGE